MTQLLLERLLLRVVKATTAASVRCDQDAVPHLGRAGKGKFYDPEWPRRGERNMPSDTQTGLLGPRRESTRIRFAKPGEGSQLNELWGEWLGESFEVSMGQLDQGVLTNTQSQLECVLIIEDRADSRLLGMLLARPSIHLLKALDPSMRQVAAQTVTKLSGIAINPTDRGRGHGRRLVLRAVAEYRARGYRWMYGQFDSTPQLRGFYAGLGFTLHEPGRVLRGPHFLPVDFPATRPNDQWFEQHL